MYKKRWWNILKSLISLLFQIKKGNTSKARIKIYAEIGSPWRAPSSRWKYYGSIDSQTHPWQTFPRRTLLRPDTSPTDISPTRLIPDGHFPDQTHPPTDTSPTRHIPDGHFPDQTNARQIFAWVDASHNGHFPNRLNTSNNLKYLKKFRDNFGNIHAVVRTLEI